MYTNFFLGGVELRTTDSTTTTTKKHIVCTNSQDFLSLSLSSSFLTRRFCRYYQVGKPLTGQQPWNWLNKKYLERKQKKKKKIIKKKSNGKTIRKEKKKKRSRKKEKLFGRVCGLKRHRRHHHHHRFPYILLLLCTNVFPFQRIKKP